MIRIKISFVARSMVSEGESCCPRLNLGVESRQTYEMSQTFRDIKLVIEFRWWIFCFHYSNDKFWDYAFHVRERELSKRYLVITKIEPNDKMREKLQNLISIQFNFHTS